MRDPSSPAAPQDDSLKGFFRSLLRPDMESEGTSMRAKLLIAVMVGLGLAVGAETTYRVWPSQPPSDCPFEPSHSIVGIAFTGRHIRYAHADTWYPSWASDGNLYSPWTDGSVGDVKSGSGGEKATTGHATIVGDDPLNLSRKPGAVRRALSLWQPRVQRGMVLRHVLPPRDSR
jgi:hypothetical protein